MQNLRYIDLFAGVGGFRYGISRVVEARRLEAERQVADTQGGSTDSITDTSQKGRQPDITCVYSNEWDRYANSVYRRHYNECDDRDIRTVTVDQIPDCDLIVGGFPCQAFSIAGKRGGFDDTRGTLFFEIARIAQAKRPRLLLLENVKGLLSHDKGRTFATILTTLAELGYDAEWQLFDSQNHGVPQHRERVYIVGHLRGGGTRPILPITENGGVHNGSGEPDQTRSQAEVSHTLRGDCLTKSDQVFIKDTQKLSDAMRIRDVDGSSATLKGLGGGLGAKTGLYAVPVLTINRPEKRQNGRRFKTDGEPAFTLNTQDQHGVFDGMRIRRLTPVECERLQGFPDGWTEFDADGKKVSDTQRYKMMGNAATTNVVADIAKAIFAMLYPIDNTVQQV